MALGEAVRLWRGPRVVKPALEEQLSPASGRTQTSRKRCCPLNWEPKSSWTVKMPLATVRLSMQRMGPSCVPTLGASKRGEAEVVDAAGGAAAAVEPALVGKGGGEGLGVRYDSEHQAQERGEQTGTHVGSSVRGGRAGQDTARR